MIANTTKLSGEVMATQLWDMTEASRELEHSKIEVQLKLFTEQMVYQRENDCRLYESALTANENVRLAILKQGEVMSCLTHLSTILSRGLHIVLEESTKMNSDNRNDVTAASPTPTPEP